MECVSLIQELNQGKELAKQLRNHLRPSSSSSSDGFLLIDRILRSYENALTVLAAEPAAVKSAAAPMNAAVKDRVSSNSPNSKKRKAMTKWSEQVKVRSDSAVEGPLGDGFSWRKYGQKDILGSKFPRSYFRCSHRFAQGCLATKQVQKSENDPTMYEITYNGNHTCNKVIQNTPKEERKPLLEHPISPKQEQKPLHQQQDEPSCLSFSSDTIRVKSENLDNVYTDLCRRPFQFGSDFQDDQSPFRESDLSPTLELNDIFESCCDFETGFISVPNSFTNVSMGELEEYCNLDNLELFC